MRLLITAGPTHEPLDCVRYIANRSSGRIGIELAAAAACAGHSVTLLLGPGPAEPTHTRLKTKRFRTTEDLRGLLGLEFPECDALVMAAAVADYRPIASTESPTPAKIKRRDSNLTLTLEPTPDLVAECAKNRVAGQLIVGFALETEENLLESAREKLARKGLDAILANTLDTMESPTIKNARLLTADGCVRLDPSLSKPDFARWLIKTLETRRSIGTWTDTPEIR